MNALRRIAAQTRKEIIQIVRDRLALALALVLPVLLLVLLGTSFTFSVYDVPIVVQDLDDSPASRDLINALRASISFRIVPWPVDRQPDEALATNKARAALIIPPHFGRDMARGSQTSVQILIDGSDANTATLVAGYASQVVAGFNEASGAAARPTLVQAAFRLWFNPGLDSKKFYGPGIFVLALTLFPTLLAALAMAKEGEQKTILQVYVSSISAHEFLLGKILAIMCIAACEGLILVALLLTYFGLHFAGDPTPFIVATFLYAFCVASFGVMVGAAIPNQVAAVQTVALGGYLLVFLLSGLLLPIENIPVYLRWISNLVWGTYYIRVTRDALLQGGGWPAMWVNVAAIAAIGLIFYGIAWHNMRRMQLRA